MTGLLPALAGAVCGIATLLVMRRLSDQGAIRIARARMRAHLYEIRLFNDDPVLMLRAQKNLLRWNLRYLKLALTPAAILTIPAALLALQLDALYGKRPLIAGESVVVTAEMKPGVKLEAINPTLAVTSPFQVETPTVRIASLRQACWRVRTVQTSDGVLRLKLPGETVERPIRAGAGFRYVTSDCASSMSGWIKDGCRLQSQSAESIFVAYPERKVGLAGIEAHWAVWFGLSWLLAMLLFRKRFHVTF